jgi:hypothetical protein
VLEETARRSPVARRDLLHEAQDIGFLNGSPGSYKTFVAALKRLRIKGCVIFDERTIYWTGRALPVRYVTDVEERTWLQNERDRALAALRPPGAPVIDPAAFPAWQPRKRFAVSNGMRGALRALVLARRSCPEDDMM